MKTLAELVAECESRQWSYELRHACDCEYRLTSGDRCVVASRSWHAHIDTGAVRLEAQGDSLAEALAAAMAGVEAALRKEREHAA